MSSEYGYGDGEPRGESVTRWGVAVGLAVVVALVFYCMRQAYRLIAVTNNAPMRASRSQRDALRLDDDPLPGPFRSSPAGPVGQSYASSAPRRAPLYASTASRAPLSPAAALSELDAREKATRAAYVKPLRDLLELIRRTDSQRALGEIAAAGSASPARAAAKPPSIAAAAPPAASGDFAPAAPTVPGFNNPNPGTTVDDAGGAKLPVPENPEKDAEARVQQARDRVHTETEALSALVGLYGHPAYYPPEMRSGVRRAAAEMRAYLKTVEEAADYPQARGALQQDASRHLAAAQSALQSMESASSRDLQIASPAAP